MFSRLLAIAVFFAAIIYMVLDISSLMVQQAEFGELYTSALAQPAFHASVALLAAVAWSKSMREPQKAAEVAGG